jgi:hypothetical protein
LSMDTEVLTPDGWKRRDSVAVDDDVIAVDQITGLAEVVTVDAIGDRAVRDDERLVEWDSQHMSISVTEGHNMLVRRRRGQGAWTLEKAGSVLDRNTEYEIPLAAWAWDQGESSLSDDQIRFIAWTYTDSHIDERGRLEIYQSKSAVIAHIRSLLSRLGVTFRERQRETEGYGGTKFGTTFYITAPDATLMAYGRVPGPKIGSVVSPHLGRLSPAQFAVLFDELLLGDGSRQNDKSGWLWTPSRAIADALCAMAVVRGFASSIADELTPAGEPIYRVTAREKSSIRSNPKDPRATRITARGPAAGERVWCLSNRLGTLIARRNGKAFVVGNCQPVSCVILLRPESFQSTLIQMVGRGLRTVDAERYPGIIKTDCVVLDFGRSLLKYGTIEQALDMEGKKPGAAPMKLCLECHNGIPSNCKQCPLCGAPCPVVPVMTREADEPDDPGEQLALEVNDLTMMELDLLLGASPFRWWQINPRAMVACAFEVFAVAFQQGGVWHAFGGRDNDGFVHRLAVGTQQAAVAQGEDYLRNCGTAAQAHKSASWMTERPTDKQRAYLQRLGAPPAATRYEAQCRITLAKAKPTIETIVGARRRADPALDEVTA